MGSHLGIHRKLGFSPLRTVHKTVLGHLLRDIGRREKTPTPKTRVSIWTLLRIPGRFATRPLPVHFTTKMSVVRPFSVLSKDEIGPHSKTGRFLTSKAEILGVGVFDPLPKIGPPDRSRYRRGGPLAVDGGEAEIA